METLKTAAPPRMTADEIAYHPRDFRAIADLLLSDTGIRLGEENSRLVFSRLVNHVRRLGLESFSDYVSMVRAPGGDAERYRMATSLATHTTRFFRESDHFQTLATTVLPPLVARAREGASLRFWSAGCSTGEEAYSIAAVVLDALPEAASLDVRILATDLSREVLGTAAAARYRKAGTEDVPQRLAGLLFEPDADPDLVGIRQPVRDIVTFRYMNFMEPWPLRGPFDAIFCRNVAIYMDEATQARLWAGLSSVLGPRGYLFIGHSERIGPEFRDRLELCDKTTFRRPDAFAAATDIGSAGHGS